MTSSRRASGAAGDGGIMSDPAIKRTRRRLPHWTFEGSTYFITFRLAQGELSPAERRMILDHLHRGNGPFYILLGAVIMNDHAHLLLKPNFGTELPRVMKGIKGASARLINQHRGTKGTI
jgi:REP element-mobilizing transposase RayT